MERNNFWFFSKLVGDIIGQKSIPWFRRLPFFYAPCAFRGRLQPAAEFLELGLSPSDSEKFLTPPISNGIFPERLTKRTVETFYDAIKDDDRHF